MSSEVKEQKDLKKGFIEIAQEQFDAIKKSNISTEEKDQRLIALVADWIDSAAQFSRNEEFYRGLIQKIGEGFGIAAKTCDDGGISEDVLVTKVPELVDKLRKDYLELGKSHDQGSLTTEIELQSDQAAFDTYAETLDKVLTNYISTEIMSSLLVGEINCREEEVKAIIKSYLCRKWLNEHHQ